MPTGYTAGIESGTIKTFPQFAKICMRAFGACIDQRDESPDVPIKLNVADVSYYEDSIDRLDREREELAIKSDSQLLNEEYSRIVDEITRYEQKIVDNKKLEKNYKAMLNDVNNWTPPTKEHERFKRFMVEQLTGSMNNDCDVEYYQERLNNAKRSLTELSLKRVKEIRKEKLDSIQEEIRRDLERIKEVILDRWVRRNSPFPNN